MVAIVWSPPPVTSCRTCGKSHPRIGKGWQLNTIVTMRSGNAFHLTLFDNYNNTGEFFPRPDLIGDPYAGTSAPNTLINLAAFKVPCTLDPSGDGSAGSCIPGTWHFGSAWPQRLARSEL